MSKVKKEVKEEIKKKDNVQSKTINWAKVGGYGFISLLVIGVLDFLFTLLMVLNTGKFTTIVCVTFVCIFSILASALLIFSIACLIIAKVKWCKKMETNMDLILEKLNKK